MKRTFLTLTLSILAITGSIAQEANKIISDMVEAIGGKENYYNKGGVSYNIEYNNPNSSIAFAGKETYVFDKELSSGVYTKHSLIAPDGGNVVEGYDGTDAWVKLNGQLLTDPKPNGVARFLRKTNYYWFSMLFKLQDSGVNLKHTGTASVDGRNYDLIKVTFGDKIGDAQDTYVLYVNQRTKLVDQFLFTVVGFGVKDPFLMKLNYETVDGIKIPSERTYIEANWQGDIIGKKWTTTYWENIEFGIANDATLFNK